MGWWAVEWLGAPWHRPFRACQTHPGQRGICMGPASLWFPRRRLVSSDGSRVSSHRSSSRCWEMLRAKCWLEDHRGRRNGGTQMAQQFLAWLHWLLASAGLAFPLACWGSYSFHRNQIPSSRWLQYINMSQDLGLCEAVLEPVKSKVLISILRNDSNQVQATLK